MKIFDASPLIAIFCDIDRPDLVDKILLLGHVLAVARRVCGYGLLDDITHDAVTRLIKEKKMIILDVDRHELKEFIKENPGMDMGEYCVMVAYKGHTDGRGRNYCIIDDKRAGKTAGALEIPYGGIVDVIIGLRNRGITTGRGGRGVVWPA